METFDVIVIGSGQGGDPLAREFANRGKKTALMEHGPIGGTCINTGCTPTKTMIASGRVAYLAKRSEEFGILTGPVQTNMEKVRERKRSMVEDFRSSSEKTDEETKHLTIVRETASFTGAKTLQAGSLSLTAEIIVIDTGSVPIVPPIPGLDQVPFLDNASIMESDEVPFHLIVLGGSYEGAEFAQLFRRLGSKVSVLEQGKHLVSREDPDISEALEGIFKEDGIDVILGRKIIQVSGHEQRLAVEFEDGQSLEGSHLLVATGRAANTKALNLSATGIKTTPKGAITVNERLETNVPGVYAMGDVNGGPQFTHISYDDFRILRANLLDAGKKTTNGRLVPYVVFTDPELGRVGLSETEAKKAGVKYKVARLPMNRVARALETGESRGLMKVLISPRSKQILGAAVLSVEGGEIMNMLQIAMMGKLPYSALRDGIFAHPTLGECLNNLFEGV